MLTVVELDPAELVEHDQGVETPLWQVTDVVPEKDVLVIHAPWVSSQSFRVVLDGTQVPPTVVAAAATSEVFRLKRILPPETEPWMSNRTPW
jgi:hypothetical protein